MCELGQDLDKLCKRLEQQTETRIHLMQMQQILDLLRCPTDKGRRELRLNQGCILSKFIATTRGEQELFESSIAQYQSNVSAQRTKVKADLDRAVEEAAGKVAKLKADLQNALEQVAYTVLSHGAAPAVDQTTSLQCELAEAEAVQKQAEQTREEVLESTDKSAKEEFTDIMSDLEREFKRRTGILRRAYDQTISCIKMARNSLCAERSSIVLMRVAKFAVVKGHGKEFVGMLQRLLCHGTMTVHQFIDKTNGLIGRDVFPSDTRAALVKDMERIIRDESGPKLFAVLREYVL